MKEWNSGYNELCSGFLGVVKVGELEAAGPTRRQARPSQDSPRRQRDQTGAKTPQNCLSNSMSLWDDCHERQPNLNTNSFVSPVETDLVGPPDLRPIVPS